MPKIKIAELLQSGGSETDPPCIVNLAADEEAMMTGTMGGCCSAIVLWNKDENGRYQNVRGHHADAHPDHIAWSKLLVGVPNDPAKARIIIICAPDDLNPADAYNYKVKIMKVVPKLFGRQVVCALVPEFHGFPNGLVSRTGDVSKFESENRKDYEIRKSNPVPI